MRKVESCFQRLEQRYALFTPGPARADRFWETVSPAPAAVVRTTLFSLRQQSQNQPAHRKADTTSGTNEKTTELLLAVLLFAFLASALSLLSALSLVATGLLALISASVLMTLISPCGLVTLVSSCGFMALISMLISPKRLRSSARKPSPRAKAFR
jgi:hypothetical protein